MNPVDNGTTKIAETNTTCCQGFLRNRRVYQATTTCQTLGAVIGLTAAVAGFYFASLHESYSHYAYALGAAGVIMLLFNTFALGYSIDYGRILVEVRKVRTLEEANAGLQDQLKILDQMEAGLAREGDELEASLVVLKDQVANMTTHVSDLNTEVSTAGQTNATLREVSEGIKDNEKRLSLELARLTEVVEDVNEIYVKAQQQNLEILTSIEQAERKVLIRETAFLEMIDKTDQLARLQGICEDLGKLKRENPQKYEELVAQIPALTV